MKQRSGCSTQDAHVSHQSAWLGFPALSPLSCFPITVGQGGSGDGIGNWVLVTARPGLNS